jgi:hypothetical protein
MMQSSIDPHDVGSIGNSINSDGEELAISMLSDLVAQ